MIKLNNKGGQKMKLFQESKGLKLVKNELREKDVLIDKQHKEILRLRVVLREEMNLTKQEG